MDTEFNEKLVKKAKNYVRDNEDDSGLDDVSLVNYICKIWKDECSKQNVAELTDINPDSAYSKSEYVFFSLLKKVIDSVYKDDLIPFAMIYSLETDIENSGMQYFSGYYYYGLDNKHDYMEIGPFLRLFSFDLLKDNIEDIFSFHHANRSFIPSIPFDELNWDDDGYHDYLLKDNKFYIERYIKVLVRQYKQLVNRISCKKL